MSQSIHSVIFRQYFYIFRHVALRYAFTTAFCVSFYTLINWKLTMKDGPSPIDEGVVDSLFPFAFALICVLISIVPKLKLIGSDHEDDIDFGYWTFGVLAAFTFFTALPTIATQHYLREATGKSIQLDNIYEMSAKPEGRFYTLKEYYVSNEHVPKKIDLEYLGKNRYSIRFTCYCLFPVYRNIGDVDKEPGAWLTESYSEETTNPQDDQKTEEIRKKFEAACNDIVRDEYFDHYTYLFRMGSGREKDMYLSFLPEQTLHAPILCLSAEPLHFRIDDKRSWMKTTFIFTILFCFIFPAVVPMKDISLVFSGKN